MDVKASVDPSPLPAAVACEPSPAEGELPEATQAVSSHIDRDGPVGDSHQEKLTHAGSSDALGCPFKSSAGSANAEDGVPSGSSPKASITLIKGIADESSALDIRFGSNENGATCSGRTDASLDIEAGRNGAHLDANVASESLDLEKGICALTPQSHVTENGSDQVKAVELGKLDQKSSSEEKICRVCYLGHAAQPESGPAIELGCECKDDLAFAHRQCAEAWFKIKGNRTCEICGSTVQNVKGVGDATFIENWNDGDTRAATTSYGAACWQNHRLLNVLVACIVFAFVLPWLFHASLFFT